MKSKHQQEAETVTNDIAEYLAAGNIIEQIPTGASGIKDKNGLRRCVTCGNHKSPKHFCSTSRGRSFTCNDCADEFVRKSRA